MNKRPLATDTLRFLVDHKKVKLDIKERDKFPNIDGYIELLDESRIPIAKLEVQIRKLPDGGKKIQCPLSLLSYAERACLPVLFVGVDVKQTKAYWVHLKKELVSDSTIGRNQKTKSITFPISNLIDGKASDYIDEWIHIAQTYQKKIQEYDKLKDLYELLSKESNAALGIDNNDFRDIHKFLDEINRLLDGNFSIVKKIFYPTAWKLGLAYYRYEDNSVSYTIYPISHTTNDVQIKEGNDLLRKDLWEKGLGVTGHNFENPFKLKPKEYAIEIVESKTLRTLENRGLNHFGSEFLAREYIFAFIDKFIQQPGAHTRNKYTLDELENVFFKHLPITKQQGQVPLITLIRNDRFNTRMFVGFLSLLKRKGFSEIERAYLPKDYSRLSKKPGWIWSLYSPNALEKNLLIFFENLAKVYDDISSRNFPQIAKEMPLFGKATLTIIAFSAKEEYRTFKDAPTISFFHFEREKQENLEIEILGEEESKKLPYLSWDYLGKDVEIKGMKHKLVSGSRGVLDFIYDDLPMFNFVYKILEENLKGYFNNLRTHYRT